MQNYDRGHSALTEWGLLTPPRWIGLASITTMFGDALVGQALKVTTIYALASVPIHLAVGRLLVVLLNSQISFLLYSNLDFDYLPYRFCHCVAPTFHRDIQQGSGVRCLQAIHKIPTVPARD